MFISVYILCLMCFPLLVGVLCLSLFCYALLCGVSCFAIILKRKRKLVALLLLSYRCILTINVLWLFLNGAVGCSAVCDCGISWSCSLNCGANLAFSVIPPTSPTHKRKECMKNYWAARLFRVFIISPWARRGHHAPLRALWEWYNIVHWTSLLKNQDINTRHVGSHPPLWMVLRWPPWKKDKMPI